MARANAKPVEAPRAHTVAEYRRLMDLVADKPTTVRNEMDYYDAMTLEGIHHPQTMCKWLPAMHMLVKGTSSMAEIQRLMASSPNVVRQHRARREERLMLLQAQGKLKFSDLVF